MRDFQQKGVAEGASAAQAVVLLQDGAQEIVRMQKALHDDVGLAAGHRCHRRRSRRIAIGDVDELGAREVDAGALGDGQGFRAIAVEDRIGHALTFGAGRGFEHGLHVGAGDGHAETLLLPGERRRSGSPWASSCLPV